jgi:catechol-2,3-dioxygenase
MSGVRVTGLNELVLEVLDLDRAVAFYRDVLGLPVFALHEHRAWFLAGRSRIGLWTPQVGLANGRGGVHVHYALHLDESDFEDTVSRLDAHGLEPEVISFEDEGRGQAVYVTDPDGNVVELWTWDVARDTAKAVAG